ncbi:TPA: TraR/DksA family transcriptional regulator, partial [Aeromonas hydrophila]
MCDFMTEDQLAFYKGQIERQILELEDRLNSQASQAIATDTNEMADEIDRASIEEARRLELNRIEHDKLHLRKLRGALKRISEGDFGYCESCGDEISLKRLQARPESRFCV